MFADRQSWLFTGVLPNGYGAPNSFCFDSGCSDQPIMVSHCLSTLYPLDQLFDSRMMNVCTTTMCGTVLKHSFYRHSWKFAQR